MRRAFRSRAHTGLQTRAPRAPTKRRERRDRDDADTTATAVCSPLHCVLVSMPSLEWEEFTRYVLVNALRTVERLEQQNEASWQRNAHAQLWPPVCGFALLC